MCRHIQAIVESLHQGIPESRWPPFKMPIRPTHDLCDGARPTPKDTSGPRRAQNRCPWTLVAPTMIHAATARCQLAPQVLSRTTMGVSAVNLFAIANTRVGAKRHKRCKQQAAVQSDISGESNNLLLQQRLPSGRHTVRLRLLLHTTKPAADSTPASLLFLTLLPAVARLSPCHQCTTTSCYLYLRWHGPARDPPSQASRRARTPPSCTHAAWPWPPGGCHI